MPGSSFQSAADSQYLAAIERIDEMARLQAQAKRRKSLLLFGPEGVGKTRLLQSFLKTQPLALHIPQTQSPRGLLLTLVDDLHALAKPGLNLPPNVESLSTKSLKGVVMRTLDLFPFLLVLDHLAGPSRVLTGLIKDLNYFERTPVVFVARSPHMEDIGALQPMCAGRSEKLELRDFAPPVALEFAQREAHRSGLWASNLDLVLDSLVEWGNGNPGSIVQMVKMAHFERYRMNDQIKVHVLYLDYRMGNRE